MFTWPGRWPLHRTGGAAEARGRPRLHHSLDLHKRATVTVMRVRWRLVHTEDGREAYLPPLHQAAPFIAGLGAENRRQSFGQRRPRGLIVLAREFLMFQAG